MHLLKQDSVSLFRQRNALITQPEETYWCEVFGSANVQECLFRMEQISECCEFSLNFIGEVIACINLLLWTCGLLIFEPAWTKYGW